MTARFGERQDRRQHDHRQADVAVRRYAAVRVKWIASPKSERERASARAPSQRTARRRPTR